MDDVISRKSAIDALDKEYRCTDQSDDWDGLKTAILIIESLPSAQAEIIRCKECDYWDKRQGRMYCCEIYFDQDDPDFYCGYAKRKIDG